MRNKSVLSHSWGRTEPRTGPECPSGTTHKNGRCGKSRSARCNGGGPSSLEGRRRFPSASRLQIIWRPSREGPPPLHPSGFAAPPRHENLAKRHENAILFESVQRETEYFHGAKDKTPCVLLVGWPTIHSGARVLPESFHQEPTTTSSKIDAATNHAVFLCLFAGFSCPVALPRPEGGNDAREVGEGCRVNESPRQGELEGQWRQPSSRTTSASFQSRRRLGKATGFCVSPEGPGGHFPQSRSRAQTSGE